MTHKICKTAKELTGLLFVLCSLLFSAALNVACGDFFEQESDHLIFADKDHLTNWSDTVFSVTGILGQLQNIADRTILLGEVRGDLVTLTDNASADLRELATFSVSDDNKYNHPSDYYSVINNCNYYIANVDTALRSNRGDYIFMKEYIAVKSIRAWTYLQLVLNYGSVPFVTEPVLTKDASEANYPRYELAQVCQYFIDDLTGLPETYETQYPSPGNYYFFPIDIVRGDLYLWLGSTMGTEGGKSYFEKAAQAYLRFIKRRNENSYYATSSVRVMWPTSQGTTNWYMAYDLDYISSFLLSLGHDAELITAVLSNSTPAQGYYCRLPELFNSTEENDYKASITPSQRIIELSEAQTNCVVSSNAGNVIVTYSPSGLSNYMSGDLRLSSVWSKRERTINNNRVEEQEISKYDSRFVRLYRRTLVYLRLAEALNLAGQPRLAYKILERGLTDKVISDEVYPYLNTADSTWVKANVSFPAAFYETIDVSEFSRGLYSISGNTLNTLGLHSRGSGYSPLNEYYKLDYADSICVSMQPDSTRFFNDAAYQSIKKRQMEQVDSLILNEEALEFSFEGYRYHDLMRFAMRSDNPGKFLTDAVNRRGGKDTSAGIDLTNPHNWYLRWGNGKIGY
ncbi:MAG: RagB/SusD family nutrient uptake outer membrane protein [Prevotella sp.]|nr:RagB/SusD family nutrient uptake outer membrane protein [Prevotella sp.]MBR6188096.1 RagB/SusD family nutrient uptake outer membrane protein [Prevotella sp.]